MNDKYKRRFTPQAREHKTKGLPQISHGKDHPNEDYDFRMSGYGLSAKKTSNFTDMHNSKPAMPNGRLRERSAGARIDANNDKNGGHPRTDTYSGFRQQKEYMTTVGSREIGTLGKASMSHTNNFGMVGFSATKRESSSKTPTDKFYSSYAKEGNSATIPNYSWTTSALKPQFAVKSESNGKQNTLVPNKSASHLIGNSIQLKTLTGQKMRPSYLKTPNSYGKNYPGGAGPVRANHKACPRNIPRIEQPRTSGTSFHVIKSYAVNTCKGLVRPYNEDRVSIILNMLKPESKRCKRWPVCSFFGVGCSHLGFRWPWWECLL